MSNRPHSAPRPHHLRPIRSPQPQWRIVALAEDVAIRAAWEAADHPVHERDHDPAVVLVDSPVGRWLVADGRACHDHDHITMPVLLGGIARATLARHHPPAADAYADAFARTLHAHGIPAWCQWYPRTAGRPRRTGQAIAS